MADDLGRDDDTTFRQGGALHKIHDLAQMWERRARAAERRIAVRLVSVFAAGVATGLAVAPYVAGGLAHYFHR